MLQGNPALLKPVSIGVGLAIALDGVVLTAHWWSVQPNASGYFLFFALIPWLFPLLVSPFALLWLIVHLFRRKSRSGAIESRQVVIVSALLAILLIQITANPLRAGWNIKRHYYEKFAERSRPLIHAIQEYSRKNGRPPDRLTDLVPAYLKSLPETGLPFDKEYIYYNQLNRPKRYPDNHYGNPWVLSVSTPSGTLNFDYIFYYPLQNYPRHNESGSIERIADWAYCHE